MTLITSSGFAGTVERQSALITALAIVLGSTSVGAQTSGSPPASSAHAGMQQPTSQSRDLEAQIAELRAQVAKLQATLDQSKPAPAPGMKGMQQPDKAMAGGMRMMNMHKGEMGMPPEGMKMPAGMMEKMEKMEKMDMMEMMNEMGMKPAGGGMPMGAAPPASASGASGMAMPAKPATAPARSVSALPGFSGASHLYHIGSTGFFLDQDRVAFSAEQQASLNQIKQRALLERSQSERRAEQAEEELWALTSGGQPDAAKVAAKVQEIERIRANARLSFIRAVGEASKVLTADQRSALLGTSVPQK